ncbi:hypothetical protein GGR52DRAFT_575316 [Hypoxylon sp. FL1284]|nr:hypothetical protein GGR52DRAFT_575316 [Hypoxylon sp. FL1284]
MSRQYVPVPGVSQSMVDLGIPPGLHFPPRARHVHPMIIDMMPLLDMAQNEMNLWLAWKDMIPNPPSDKAKAVGRLDRAVKITNLLLKEWWDAEESVHDSKFIERILEVAESPSEGLPRMDGQTYRDVLYDLWKQELYSNQYGEGIILRRFRAARVAAAHRTALAFRSDSVQNNVSGQPRFRIQETPIPACFEPCAWLEYREWEGELPHFLWDIHARATVTKFPEKVEYLVISHTWGRWRIQGPGVAVDGVPWLVPSNTLFDVRQLPDILSRVPFKTRYVWFDLVCIPQDESDLQTREISRQALIFKSAKWAMVWFNRLDNFAGLRAACKWVSYLYLSTLKSYSFDPISEDLIASLARLASQTTGLANTVEDEDGDHYDRLFFSRSEGSSTKYMIPDGWFTSLWTLQEACLRPDLYLCNKNWEVFRAEGPTGMAVPIDHIISLLDLALHDNLFPSDLPRGVHELLGILHKTAMMKLLDMSLVDLLVFGNQRHCADTNRAVAIMSALGTTAWYGAWLAYRAEHPELSEEQLIETTLVQGRFPLDFVREVHARFGGLLFAAVDTTGLAANHYRFSRWPWRRRTRIRDTALRATMMPFGRDIRRARAVPAPDLVDGVDSHPAVAGWAVALDGSVRVPAAGVMAAWPASTYPPLSADVAVVQPLGRPGGGATQFRGAVEVNAWLGSFRPRAEKLAVCLLRKPGKDHSLCVGALLEKVYVKGSDNLFMKFGVFLFVQGEAFEFPPSKPLDIRIL